MWVRWWDGETASSGFWLCWADVIHLFETIVCLSAAAAGQFPSIRSVTWARRKGAHTARHHPFILSLPSITCALALAIAGAMSTQLS